MVGQSEGISEASGAARPASSTSTRRPGSADRRLASTQPADPAPMMIVSYTCFSEIVLIDGLRTGLASAVDLAAHDGDGLLVDLRGVPGLDGGEVGFARLVSGAGAPAVGLQKIRRRVQRVGGDVEVAGAVGQDVLGHELGLADLAMHRAAGAPRQRATVDQLQRRIKLIGEKLRP